PSPRMQYTASSFAQPLTDTFDLLLQTRRVLIAPDGLFPKEASLATETPDPYQEYIYRPLFRAIGRDLLLLRPLQQGQVQLYILYIAVTPPSAPALAASVTHESAINIAIAPCDGTRSPHSGSYQSHQGRCRRPRWSATLAAISRPVEAGPERRGIQPDDYVGLPGGTSSGSCVHDLCHRATSFRSFSG